MLGGVINRGLAVRHVAYYGERDQAGLPEGGCTSATLREHRSRCCGEGRGVQAAGRTEFLAVIQEIQREGFVTLAAIADELNHRGIRTARCRRWHPTTAMLVLRAASAHWAWDEVKGL